VLAGNKQDEFDEGVQAGKLYSELKPIDDAGKGLLSGQIAALVAGGIIAAAGGALILWEKLGKDKEQDARISGLMLAPYATSSGAGVAGQLRF